MKQRGLMLFLVSLVVCTLITLMLWIVVSPNLMPGWFSMSIVSAFLCTRDYYNYRFNSADEFSLR